MATGWLASAVGLAPGPPPSSFHLELNPREARPRAKETRQRAPPASPAGLPVLFVFYTHFSAHYIRQPMPTAVFYRQPWSLAG